MEYLESALSEIKVKRSELGNATSLVGFDGFVDKIVKPVDQRHGPGDQFTPIDTIDGFGRRISAAAGKSTNIELYPTLEKLGGNGPIMANALRSLGHQTRYIGALGKPEIHPVFKEFAAQTEAISIEEPGVTHAVEFTDGKIMLGNMANLDHVNYAAIVSAMGEGKFIDLISRMDSISMVNWTMLNGMGNIFESLLTTVFPNLGPHENRHFFFDLADPQKRSDGDILAALKQISRFEQHGHVTFGLNFKESQHIARLLGKPAGENEPELLQQLCLDIREELDISCVVVHPTNACACATKEGSAYVKPPYCEAPVITTGAGDHFNAGFLTGRKMGLSATSSLVLAGSVSGFYVRNAKSPSLNDIDNFITQWKDQTL